MHDSIRVILRKTFTQSQWFEAQTAIQKRCKLTRSSEMPFCVMFCTYRRHPSRFLTDSWHIPRW